MPSIRIEANEDCNDVANYLAEGLKNFNDTINIKCLISNLDNKQAVSITCNIKESKFRGLLAPELHNSMVMTLANILADYIILKFEKRLVTRIINTNYCYFSAAERNKILGLAMQEVKSDTTLINGLLQIRKRNTVVQTLQKYLEESDIVILEGFTNFRLKDYIRELEEIVDTAVNNFLMEKEYTEFIQLLRYFVETQQSKCDIVHIVVDHDGTHTLIDSQKNEITHAHIQEFSKEPVFEEITHDDLLISSLITLAPKQLIVHNVNFFRNKKLLETIKSVFRGKVQICPDCDICTIKV